VGTLGEFSDRIKDYVLSFGERLSSVIMGAVLEGIGMGVEVMTGFDAGIITDSNFGEARPLHEISEKLVKDKVGRVLSEGKIPVITGFIAGTLVGRGGSDYTATLIAKYLGANEVRLYTDAEAMELAYLGTKRFHPRTFEPLLNTSIRVRVTSLSNPEGGTLIDRLGGPPPLKAVATLRNLSLINVRGAGMVERLGTAAEVMGRAASSGVNIVAIAQPASEESITLVIDENNTEELKRKLEELMGRGVIREVESLSNISAVSVVGHGLRDNRVLSKILGKVARSYNEMIVWFKGNVSLTMVIRDEFLSDFVNMLHGEVLSYG
ncbi:MAG TPA: hypothetical protein ENG05_02185, partial [Acidilobales archaeon]|nr:hypothetical protein [Acidilobales archaeon]